VVATSFFRLKKAWWLQMNYYAWKMQAPRSQCFSFQMNNRHQMQLKKSNSWGPFLRYQLNSAANPAYLSQKWAKRLDWQSCLAGSSKTAPRILIFSIAMGAKTLF
jgi:hypothetical protein